MTVRLLKLLLILLLMVPLGGCLGGAQKTAKDPWLGMRKADGTVTWMEECNFTPPPAPWRILDLSEDDFSLAFFNSCYDADPGSYPCEATIAYASEPFGYSQDLQQRQKEFFKRFLWASRLNFSEPDLRETSVDGRKALVAEILGTEPAMGHRVKSKVIFIQRGERVEALFMNQWRSRDNPFDPAEFERFDQFVGGFKYVKPSFFETL